MDTIGSRLRYLRDLCNLTQRKVAESLNVSGQAVTAWENDRNNMTVENAISFHRLTGCDLHWLLTGEGIRAELMASSGHEISHGSGSQQMSRFIPMLNVGEIGRLGRETLDEILKDREDKVVLHKTSFPCSPSSFWFEVNGKENEPVYKKEDRACIDPEVQLKPGDMVLVRVATTERLFFGVYRPRSVNFGKKDLFDLEFLNPQWPVLKYEDMDNPELMGVMTEMAIPRRD